MELVAAADEEGLVEAHEIADLVPGPAPVLGREGEDGEPADPDGQGPFDGVEQGLLARRVAGRAGQAPLAGPAAVAVHDTTHMGGDAGEIDAVRRRRKVGDHHPNLLPGAATSAPSPARGRREIAS